MSCILLSSFLSSTLSQRNGADYSVFINTASEFDGSDSGARPDEAISWGKIKEDAKPVKVRCNNYVCGRIFSAMHVGLIVIKSYF